MYTVVLVCQTIKSLMIMSLKKDFGRSLLTSVPHNGLEHDHQKELYDRKRHGDTSQIAALICNTSLSYHSSESI